MKSITLIITDEEHQISKDLKYHFGITQKEIYKAGIKLLKDRIVVDLSKNA